MSAYTKSTNFASKDALASGNPLKIVKGTEIDNEFNAIAIAVNSKIEGNNTILTGTPTVPTAAVTVASTQAASTAFVHNVLPKGIVMLWSGSSASIPSGWALCNGATIGSLVTPDLRDKFLVGAGTTYIVGATGGSADSIVVSHTHTGTTAAAGTHSHTISSVSAFNDADSAGAPVDGITGTSIADGGRSLAASATLQATAILTTAPDHTHTITTGSTGASGTNANLPPYYALCYIIKTTGI